MDVPVKNRKAINEVRNKLIKIGTERKNIPKRAKVIIIKEGIVTPQNFIYDNKNLIFFKGIIKNNILN